MEVHNESRGVHIQLHDWISTLKVLNIHKMSHTQVFLHEVQNKKLLQACFNWLCIRPTLQYTIKS